MMYQSLRRAKRAYYAARHSRPSPLTGNGERVDIDLTRPLRERKLDIYQLSHLRRYQFALSQIKAGARVGDLACGTGYGSALLASRAKNVIGGDRDARSVNAAIERYRNRANVSYLQIDLINLGVDEMFDTIVSFETLEHFVEADLLRVLRRFHDALVPGGRLIFSTPYLQENSEAARILGFHQTFLIDEEKIEAWLKVTRFRSIAYFYQSYSSHDVVPSMPVKDFILCVAESFE
jgi:2-polyprenyl-3-methyl-5-hydroxy-6-metoxy-1,4-benzoquinol methylase